MSADINPSDWTPLIVAIGASAVSAIGAIGALIVSLRTGQKTDTIVHSVDGGMKAAQEEIKRLGGIVEQFAKSGKTITEQEAGLILNKVIDVANGAHKIAPPVTTKSIPPEGLK